VQDEDEVSEYCAVMARHHRATGDAGHAAKFELLGGRHRERAAKIAALLPPALARSRQLGLHVVPQPEAARNAFALLPRRTFGGSSSRNRTLPPPITV
jgi:hypothetical protein